jgi:hypothetical protein
MKLAEIMGIFAYNVPIHTSESAQNRFTNLPRVKAGEASGTSDPGQ